jgi:hypothetical protein
MQRRAEVERLWWSRLRWRMRGAWQWPAFLTLTAVDGVLLNELPFYEGGPGGIVPGVLLAGFANLFCVAALAPLVGLAVRAGRPDLPRQIAANYAGTALLVGLTAALVAAGLAHRPAVRAEEDDRRAGFAAVRAYVGAHAREFRLGLPVADTLRLDADLYRTCVPGTNPKRPLCMFVTTDRRPPRLRVDGDRTPNAAYRR